MVLGRVAWAGAVVAAIAFLAHSAVRFLVFTEASYRIFWANRYWLLLHFAGGSIALICGLPQFSARLRERHRALHRWTGRLYLSGVAIGVISAWYMSFHAAIGWTVGVATFFLGVAWVVTTGMAYLAIMRRQFPVHREWMIRSYVVTFTFVFFRALFATPLFAGSATVQERTTALLWMSFFVPLLMTDVILQWRQQHSAEDAAFENRSMADRPTHAHPKAP